MGQPSGRGDLGSTPVVAVTGVIGAVVGFAVMRLTAPCVYLCDRGVGFGDHNSLLRRIVFFEIPEAARVGLACGFLALVGAAVWSRRQRDPLAVAATLGMTWILVGGFTQTLLYNLNVNVTTDWANAFWTVSFLAAILVLLVYVARKVAAADSPSGASEPVD